MRAALIVSALVHLVILAAAVISLPSDKGFATPPVSALPIEIVTIDEETDLTLGRADETEVAVAPAPETVEAETPPEPEAQPGDADTPAEAVATDEKAIDSPVESSAPQLSGEPAPEPEPEPEVAEPEPEAAPPEPQPDPEPQPTPEVADPEPEPLPETEPLEVVERPAPVPETVVPRVRPTPPKRTRVARQQPPREDEFDADRISSLLSRTNPTGGGVGAAQAGAGAETGREGAPLTASERDALMEAVRRCWTVPYAATTDDELVVVVHMQLAQDGSLQQIVDVRWEGVGPLFDIAGEAARRAVIQCAPYDFLPPAKYERWRDIAVTFDPRDVQ